MKQFEETSKYLERILGYIHSDNISDADKELMTKETVHHFDNYVSPGLFIHSRMRSFLSCNCSFSIVPPFLLSFYKKRDAFLHPSFVLIQSD